MKTLFDTISYKTSQHITKFYSTSFSKGISLLHRSIQPKIYAIYGFVRLADEIVDSFDGYNQKKLLNKLEKDYLQSLEEKISINPVLNAFQEVVIEYNLNDLVFDFLKSMKMDLSEKNYTESEMYKKYIHGSAEVVGLMCLKVFVNNNKHKFEELKPYAIKLGSAFQKVNFLRDIHDDMNRLGRIYFPNVDWNRFTETEKNDIISEIKAEFDQAFIGIKKLTSNCKLGVFVAYNYYKSLLKKLEKKQSNDILKKRTRIPNLFKIYILYISKLKYKIGLV